MDRAFSRRSFLKCTAWTAVAIAGAGLLAGCKEENTPVQTTPNTSNTVLKVASKLNSAVYENGKMIFSLSVYNGRKNAIQVDRSSFSVKSSNGYYAYKDSKINVRMVSDQSPKGEDADNVVVGAQIKQGESANFIIEALDFPELASSDTVTLEFFPDLEYPEHVATWNLTADKITVPEE